MPPARGGTERHTKGPGRRPTPDSSGDSGDSAAGEEEPTAMQQRNETQAEEEEDQQVVSKYAVFKKVHHSCVKTSLN